MAKLEAQILELIQDTEGHLNAEDVFLLCREKGIKASVASVYRVLAKLSNEGAIRRLSFGDDPDRYDKMVDNHAHLICTECGAIEDVAVDEALPLVSAAVGRDVSKIELIVYARCLACEEARQEGGVA